MYKNRNVVSLVFALVLAIACGENTNSARNSETSSANQSTNEAVDSAIGIGKYTNVELTLPLDKFMIDDGRTAYDVKCVSCHKLTDEMLVGPGWKNVTTRRTPEWLMNFMTNTDEMLNKDAEAISMLEICLVRMPNQNSSDTEARAILEFMRSNDSLQTP